MNHRDSGWAYSSPPLHPYLLSFMFCWLWAGRASCPSRDPHGSNQRQQQGEVARCRSRGPGMRQGAPGHSPGGAAGLSPAMTHVTGFIICPVYPSMEDQKPCLGPHTLVQPLIHTQQAFRAHVCENEIFIRINLNPLKIHYLESNSFPAWHPSGIVIHALLPTSQLKEVDIGV